jgi:hypothetical protein
MYPALHDMYFLSWVKLEFETLYLTVVIYYFIIPLTFVLLWPGYREADFCILSDTSRKRGTDPSFTVLD